MLLLTITERVPDSIIADPTAVCHSRKIEAGLEDSIYFIFTYT